MNILGAGHFSTHRLSRLSNMFNSSSTNFGFTFQEWNEWRAGAAFTKCFYNSSTIIPSSILPQANPDAPNSSKRGRIVEELWKNCRKILRAPVRQAAGKNLTSILRLEERAQYIFYNFSTFFP
jgi:hypothetical protein